MNVLINNVKKFKEQCHINFTTKYKATRVGITTIIFKKLLKSVIRQKKKL